MRVAVGRRRKSLRNGASTSSVRPNAAVGVANARTRTETPTGTQADVQPVVTDQSPLTAAEPPTPGGPHPSGGSSRPSDEGRDEGLDESARLLRRAPSGYLWNQLYSFWTYLALFLQTLVITRALSTDEKGVYTLIERPAVFAVYLAALGLDSAATVYVPRALAEGSHAQAVGVALRLVVLRLLAVLAVGSLVLWGLPGLGALLTHFQLPGGDGLLAIVHDPRSQAHLAALSGYVIAVGLTNILASILTALLRTRIIFIVGGIAQGLTVVLAWVLVVPLHTGADGGMWALAIPNALMALAYAIVLVRVLGLRAGPVHPRVVFGMLRLGFAAWLSDLPNGSLIPLLAVAQLGAMVALSHVSFSHDTAIAFFNSAYQLGDGATFLLVNGLSGVGLAVMALAYAKRNLPHLGTAWRTVSKIQILLGVPLIAFLMPHADGIVHALYGSPYAPVGALLALFLGLSALTRLAGGGAHTAVLYVVGRSQWVVISNWLALGVLAGLDVLLIPHYGVAGALIAVGAARFVLEIMQLVVAQWSLKRPYPVAFMLRVLLALVPAVAFAIIWRPGAFPPLVLAGLGFTALFLLGLLVVRPLDAEDGALLDQVSSPLRRLLLPLVARNRGSAQPAVDR